MLRLAHGHTPRFQISAAVRVTGSIIRTLAHAVRGARATLPGHQGPLPRLLS